MSRPGGKVADRRDPLTSSKDAKMKHEFREFSTQKLGPHVIGATIPLLQ